MSAQVIKINPKARYVIFVRDADPERVATIEGSLEKWWDSPSPVTVINLKEDEQVILEKLTLKRKPRGN
jgi:hypothetical protein